MEPTGPFGPFEIVRELDSGGGATVYKARKEGDSKGEYILKIFSLERLVSEEANEQASELDPLFRDLGASFTTRVNLQKAGAERSRYFVPILAAGHDERGAWYATHFYARSIKGMLERFVALEAGDIFCILQSVVRASLHLKRTVGRSHGNLKPSNIFIEGLRKPRSSRVLVSDPLAGGAPDAGPFDDADLRAIGELLYQLVIKRKADFASGWIILPIEATRDWNQLFGKQTNAWLDLCNRLLDPHRPSGSLTLEQLDAELEKLKPKPPPILTLAPIGVAILLLVGGAVLFLAHWLKYGKLEVTTYPPGARLKVAPEGEGAEETYTTPAKEGQPLKLTLEKGQYALSVTYTGLVGSGEVKIDVRAHTTLRTNISLGYGGLVVSSEPPGAEFEFKGHTFTTPYTNLYVRPQTEPLEVHLHKAEFETTNLVGSIRSDHSLLVLSTTLRKPPPGSGLVEINSDPPGAMIFLDGASIGAAPLSRSMEGGASHTIVARLAPWFEDQTQAVTAIPNQTVKLPVYFPHGTLSVTNTDPASLEIFVNDQLAGLSPTNVYLAPGSYKVRFRADGYETNSETVAIAEKAVSERTPTLKPQGGILEFTTELPRVEVRDQNNKVWPTSLANGVSQIALPPGVYQLKALFSDLEPVELRNVQIKAGKPTRLGALNFDYATVVFSDIQPPEIRDSVTVVKERTSAKPGETIYQRPNLNMTYHVEAPGYEPVTTNIWLAPKQARQVAINLSRIKVPIKIVGSPPGTRFFLGGTTEITPVNDTYQLPWGPAQLIARHGRLGSLTNDLEVSLKGPNPPQQFNFPYGTLALTNLPEDITVYEGADKVGSPASGEVYEPPGSHAYRLISRFSPDKVLTNFTLLIRSGLNLFPSIGPPELRNSIGMALIWVDQMPGTPLKKGGWAGKFVVTQKEYQSVMGVNPSGHIGEDFPVEQVTWDQAVDFCRTLTLRDQTNGVSRGHYSLPTLEQFLYFDKGAQVKDAVIRTNTTMRVGSLSPNKWGLYDVWGNVFEWLGDNTGKEVAEGREVSCVGVPFNYRLDVPSHVEKPVALDRKVSFNTVGFRVILVPVSN